MPYFPYMGDVRQRRMNTSTRRTGSGFSVTRPSLETRESTGAVFTSAPTILPSPAICSESPRGSFDLNDEGQSGAAPAFEGG
jgi:hypothetical protein